MELQKANEIQGRINRFKFLVDWAESDKGLSSLEQSEIQTLKDTVTLLNELVEQNESTERIVELERKIAHLENENLRLRVMASEGGIKPRKKISMTESDKKSLEDYLRQVLPIDDEALLGRFAGAVRTHETNENDEEFLMVMIDELWKEIIKRMGEV